MKATIYLGGEETATYDHAAKALSRALEYISDDG